jgi:hypothetical protein
MGTWDGKSYVVMVAGHVLNPGDAPTSIIVGLERGA